MSTLKNIRIAGLSKQVLNAENLGENSIARLKDTLRSCMEIACKLHKDNDGDDEYLTNLQGRLDATLSGMVDVNSLLVDLASLRSEPVLVDSMITKYSIVLSDFDKLLEK